MDTKDKIKIMQAYVDGETIEARRKNTKGWFPTEPIWDWVDYEYRIKPKDPIKEVKNIVGKVLKYKLNDYYIFITGYNPIKEEYLVSDNSYEWYSKKELEEKFKYID
jgi:hypothetical protein